MTCNPLWKMLVLDDIVLLRTTRGVGVGVGVMATQTDHRQPVQQSILTQLLCCWCATWLDNWVTEQHASLPCHCFPSTWAIQYEAPADVTLLTQPQQVWKAGSVSESNDLVYWVSSCCGLGLHLSCACAAHTKPAKAQESQRKRRGRSQRAERQSWGGGRQSGAAWGGL